MSFEQLFASSALNIVVPDTSVELPPQTTSDDWLTRLQSSSVERKQIFFDEQLQSMLTFRVEHPTPSSPADADHPPQPLIAFLAHIQVSLEATYISPDPTPTQDSVRIARLSAPPRTSLPQSNLQLPPHHPSVFPPTTPHPTPSSAEHDRRYVASEGTLLLAQIWGQDSSEDSLEAFSLLWSDKEQLWVAVYRLSLTVSFLRLNVSDPLLCLTVSATLREKPLPLAQPNHPLRLFFASVGQPLTDPESPTTIEGTPVEPEEDIMDGGLQEVNLLTGLLGGPVFSNSGSQISLPSTRLGTASRQNLFSLPPVRLPPLPTPSPSPMTAVRIAHPTLRKSFRRTLRTVSGFRVRMRTVFVPYVLLPETQVSLDSDDAQDERERREAGNEERTVVLCVEIENSGESGSDVGFLVEKVDVKVGGEGAKATLIGWGEGSFKRDAELKTFPLQVEAMAQYNLLYAVSFLRPPEEIEGFSLSRDLQNHPTNSAAELQRPVTINIFGKPYSQPLDEDFTSYPTRTFASRWNCVLDLSTHQGQPLDQLEEDLPGGHHALPEPASPFPASAMRTMSPYSASSAPQSSATAGRKRHTLPISFANRSLKTASPNRASTPALDISHREREQLPLSGPPSRMSYIPPSVSAQMPRSPTTYSAPPPPPPPSTDSVQVHGLPNDQILPPTPAYPAYPPFLAASPIPMSQGPITSHSGNIGPAVELPRERGAGTGKAFASTPGPWVTGSFGEQKMLTHLKNVKESGEAIVVSVGLLPVERTTRNRQAGERILGPDKIYPTNRFTLDIFVFNQSTWTRRFEITCPNRRRSPKSEDDGASGAVKMGLVGILPMDSRVRIGPLRPSACQSVRMEFLALTPGVHSIDALTLTDIESGLSMNLRSVMDVVVHDTED